MNFSIFFVKLKGKKRLIFFYMIFYLFFLKIQIIWNYREENNFTGASKNF